MPLLLRFFRQLLNPVCLVGCIILATGLAASALGPATEVGDRKSSAYEGLLTFVLFPSISIIGIIIIIVGLWLERRRARKLAREKAEWTPSLDPSRSHDRGILVGMAAFGLVFFVLSMISAYHAYEFTESTVFCGETCHTPMEPQAVAHELSPHASLTCTDCHVGEGVMGYIDAKLSGVRQLLQMFGSTYPRPIYADHEKVKIAGESCQRCHRPDKWWGPKLDSRTRYGYDLWNSMRTLSLLMKPGYVDATPRPGKGIHWHMTLKNVWFRPTDENRQTIPWVKVEKTDGTTVVYEDREWKQKANNGTAGANLLAERRMECIDCHSRPAHRFLSPDVTVNGALSAGVIDESLPSIKKVAVAAVSRDYETSEAARTGIRKHIVDYYTANFGGKILERKDALESTIREAQRIYSQNSFPSMKVDWSTHPDNTGHRESPGCFRCHDGKHASSDGQLIAHECDACHVFFQKARDSESLMEVPADGSPLHSFRHPIHYKEGCWKCHGGTSSPYSECGSCHDNAVEDHAMQFECSICHRPGEPKPQGGSCGPCHPLGDSPLHAQKDHRGNCLSCHRQHTWAVAAESCQTSACHEGKGPDYLEASRERFRGVRRLMSGLPPAGR